MAEYIEREAALALAESEEYLTPDGDEIYHEYIPVSAVKSIPAADVRPVVRGHIEEDENTYLFCSECNCNITLAAYETPDNRLVLRPNFCPNCGADMREEA